MTAIQPGGRFGVLDIRENQAVAKFTEKSKEDGGWINGGFMVLNYEVFDYLEDNDKIIFEREPLEQLAKDNQLMAYKHYGFWQCMDTMRDKGYLDSLWKNDRAPWKVWK